MRPFLYVLIAVGTMAGLYGATRRYQVEERNRRVELSLDYPEVKALAEITGRPLPPVLQAFKAAGITSVAVPEDTLAALETQGHVRLGNMPTATVEVGSSDLLARVQAAFQRKGVRIETTAPPPDVGRSSETFRTAFIVPTGASTGVFAAWPDYGTLRTLGLGLDPEAVAEIKQANLDVVARISNFPGASAASMRATLDDLKHIGVQTVVFQGLEVFGYRGQFAEAAEAIRASGLQFGQVEFGKQKGDEHLGSDLKGEYVRVHSIGEAEMGTLDENEAIDRFVRAARERNIRLCYIRLLTTVGADPVQANVDYIEKIARNVRRGDEMTMGPAHLYADTEVPRWAFGLMGLGVAAGAVLLLMSLAPVPAGRAALLLGALMVVCAGLALLGESGRKLMALLAALVFPALACLRRDVLAPDDADALRATGVGRSTGAGPAALRAFGALWASSAVTALGIAHVVGLLATRPFMVKATQFLGIKAAHALPIVLIGLLAIVGLPRLDRPWAAEWGALRERAARFWGEPTRVGQLLLALVALAALALIVARTGNDPGVGVSGAEMKFRAVLDRVLPVRPRTKEFLVGHPAFVLALALWYRGRRRWAKPLFVVGVIGQVSILNTFCHIHTPLYLSFIRDVTGLVFGAVLGLAAFWLFEWLAGRAAAPARSDEIRATA